MDRPLHGAAHQRQDEPLALVKERLADVNLRLVILGRPPVGEEVGQRKTANLGQRAEIIAEVRGRETRDSLTESRLGQDKYSGGLLLPAGDLVP